MDKIIPSERERNFAKKIKQQKSKREREVYKVWNMGVRQITVFVSSGKSGERLRNQQKRDWGEGERKRKGKMK